MEEKKVLALQIATLEKQLEKKRKSWFLRIWLGYSAVAFWLLKTIQDVDGVLDFLFNDPIEFFGMLLASAVLGLVSWWINALVWANFCNSIRDTTDLMKNLEKRYNEIP